MKIEQSFVTYILIKLERNMYWFVVPLVLGFKSNAASALTALYSERWAKSVVEY
jgi:hypothetical protein